MRYGGPSSWTSTGPVGGPFSDTGFTATLGNRSSQLLQWSVTTVPSYLTVTPSSGAIQPHTRFHVQVDLNTTVANGLAAGTYATTLTFHNNTTSESDIQIPCTLTVLAPPVNSQLSPLTDFSSQGPAGGPFQPDNQIYTLTNTGTGSFDWQARASDAWVTAAPASGTLAAGASVNVNVSIDDPATGSLTVGMHQSVVEWREAATNTLLHSRNVNLNVLTGGGSSGWTVFTPSNDTRIIYVSSSTGNDSNDGLSQSTPKRTVGAGKSLLRNGFPDWLLLKCGDSWNENLNTNGEFHFNGRSLSERMLVSSYGTGDRPLLRTGTNNGVDNFSFGNHVAIVGIHFWADTYNGSQGPNRGVQWLGSPANFLLEDCYVQAYETNVVIMGGGRQTNVAVRRNVIVDAYNTLNSNSEGMFASSIDGLLVEENVFDHNGWRDDVPGSSPTWFRRNVYVQNGATGVVFRGNIIAGTDGLQLRPGGICDDNLFLQNALSLQFGSGNAPEPGGVSGSVHNNVILDGRDLQPGSPRGWGLIIGNTVNTTVDHNIVAHNVTATSPNPWVLNFDNGNGNPQGMQNVTFDHNVIFDWSSIGRNSQVASYQSNTIRNLVMTYNDVQDTLDTTYLSCLTSSTPNFIAQLHGANNRWYRANGNPAQLFSLGGTDMNFNAFKSAIGDTTSTFGPITYPDSSRTIATYHASIGGAPTLAAFMAGARLQSKANWRVQYTADAVNTYIRAGFGL